jgi:hypothetical protein
MLGMKTVRYANMAPLRVIGLVAINSANCSDLCFKAVISFDTSGEGAFVWPSVLCVSNGLLAGMGIIIFVSASRIWTLLSNFSRVGCGLPLGWKSKCKAWKEHLGSSSLPPEQ